MVTLIAWLLVARGQGEPAPEAAAMAGRPKRPVQQLPAKRRHSEVCAACWARGQVDALFRER